MCEYCEIEAIDSGWFNRYHIYCLDNGCDGNEASMDVFTQLVACSFICGLSWIGAGVLACLGSMHTSHRITMVSIIVFALAFLAFVILFGLVWDKALEVRSDCLENECEPFKSKARKSSNEFLGYSICTFILIPAAIGLTVASWFSVRVHEYFVSKKEKTATNAGRKDKLGMTTELADASKTEIDNTQLGHENEPDEKDGKDVKDEKAISDKE
eukprot:TRINITY_DN6229_c0_g2_i4.p1 TRINITY_DN6229_c0_g2~~TRINITY_DN6229_c0_g2_i4.p1  ORF type:complete len:213 (+),score=60.15 TRINITY_DN6229_c0_g2_i4:289-927(+)